MIRGLFDKFVSPVQQSYRSGNLFGGGTQLEKLLGEDVRRQAQKQAITQLGMGLLSQGPSRTPIRTSASLGQGLLGAQQAYQKSLGSQLQQAAAIKALGKPDVIKMRGPSGADVLVDQSTGKIMSDPFGSQQTTQDDVSSIIAKPIELSEVESTFDLDDAAGGEPLDKIQRFLGGAGARLTGGEPTPDITRAIAETNRLNLEMSNAIVKANGGKRTATIQKLIDENLPLTSDTNAKYRAKAKALVSSGQQQLSRSRQLLAETTNPKEKTKIREGMRELAAAVREYEIVLIKDSQRQTNTGIYSPEYKAQKQESFSEKSNQELFDTLNLGM